MLLRLLSSNINYNIERIVSVKQQFVKFFPLPTCFTVFPSTRPTSVWLLSPSGALSNQLIRRWFMKKKFRLGFRKATIYPAESFTKTEHPTQKFRFVKLSAASVSHLVNPPKEYELIKLCLTSRVYVFIQITQTTTTNLKMNKFMMFVDENYLTGKWFHCVQVLCITIGLEFVNNISCGGRKTVA